MNYDGKTYRNLEGQVAYLTEVAEALDERITEVAANIPSKMIVEELPEEGDPNITYYVGPKGTAPNYYYEVWVWVQEEPDGPFVWRELEDTDQVDLSGYLPKVETTTTRAQAYVKTTSGGQAMVDIAPTTTPLSIVTRDANAQINVPNTPTDNAHATSKKYVDDNFVAKDTSTTPYSKAYVKKTDGTQDTLSMSSTPNAGFIVQYNIGGTLRCKDPTGAGEEVVNLSYANDHYLTKNTATSSYFQAYCKNTDGSQAMCNANVGVLGGAIPLRRNNGHLAVPLLPLEAGDAASKDYVDAAVGQLLYLHDIELIITVDATNKLYVKAYLVNGSSTAITEFNRILYKRIDVQWGAFGTNMANVEPVAVTKLPNSFRQDEFDEPFVGFLYQYISGGNLISGKTDGNMSTTITDTVVSW